MGNNRRSMFRLRRPVVKPGSGVGRMTRFEPVKTKSELDALDQAEIVEGYRSAEAGDPEPGENRGRAFWWGWRCRQMDRGLIEITADHMALTRECVKANRGTHEGKHNISVYFTRRN